MDSIQSRPPFEQGPDGLPAIATLRPGSLWVCFDEHKIPYTPVVHPRTGKLTRASASNPQSWGTYSQARQTLESVVWLRGIGRQFVKDQGITGIDLDHCIDEKGGLSDFARMVVEALDSYTEYSPSGRGLHIWVYASLPANLGAKIEADDDKRIEMKDHGGYYTVTGRHFPGTPITIEKRSEALTALYHEVRKRRLAAKRQRVTPVTTPVKPPILGGTAYGHEALEKECSTLSTTKPGGRHTELFDSARRLGQLIACRVLDRSSVERELYKASVQNGLVEEDGEAHVTRTIKDGIEKGMHNLRALSTTKNATDEPLGDQATGHSNGSHHGNGAGETALGDEERPVIVIDEQLQLRDKTTQAVDALKAYAAQHSTIFVHAGSLVRAGRNEENRPMLMHLGVAELKNVLTQAANFYRLKTSAETYKLVAISPPKEIAEAILALTPGEWPLPHLKAIVEAPVLREDGTILSKPGYDEQTKLYYAPSPLLKECQVPENPSQDDAVSALHFLQPIFADFPFASDADRANAFALLLTPFVRETVKKDIQMALLDATNAGVGKGLICTVVSIAATGFPTIPMSAKRDEDEWRKAIFTELLQGPRIVVIDNIRGELSSTTLELVLTGHGINERILGSSTSAKPRNEAIWIATGNNLAIGGDLYRRCYHIRLLAQTATPEERTDFMIPDLEQWMYDHRGDVVAAILTIARAWYVAGKPKPENVPQLATFTEWAKTVGGMLEYAGMPGFQTNRDSLQSQTSKDREEWVLFLEAWYDAFGSAWKHAADITAKLGSGKNEEAIELSAGILYEALPSFLKNALADKPTTFNVVLSKQLDKRNQTVYGHKGYRLEKTMDTHSRAKLWQVTRGET